MCFLIVGKLEVKWEVREMVFGINILLIDFFTIGVNFGVYLGYENYLIS